MPIDLEKALGAELAPSEGSWSRDDVILYHLGIGAGAGRPRRARGASGASCARRGGYEPGTGVIFHKPLPVRAWRG